MLITSLLRFAAAVIALETLEQGPGKSSFAMKSEQSNPIEAIPKALSASPQASPAVCVPCPTESVVGELVPKRRGAGDPPGEVGMAAIDAGVDHRDLGAGAPGQIPGPGPALLDQVPLPEVAARRVGVRSGEREVVRRVAELHRRIRAHGLDARVTRQAPPQRGKPTGPERHAELSHLRDRGGHPKVVAGGDPVQDPARIRSQLVPARASLRASPGGRSGVETKTTACVSPGAG